MKKLLLPILLLLVSCSTEQLVKSQEVGAAMFDYDACSETLKNYVFALNPFWYDADPTQLANLESMATTVEDLDGELAMASAGPLSILTGMVKPGDDVVDRATNAYLTAKHADAESIDIDDFDGTLHDWMVNNNMPMTYDFYIAAKAATPGWIHLQKVAPPSGDRVFTP